MISSSRMNTTPAPWPGKTPISGMSTSPMRSTSPILPGMPVTRKTPWSFFPAWERHQARSPFLFQAPASHGALPFLQTLQTARTQSNSSNYYSAQPELRRSKRMALHQSLPPMSAPRIFARFLNRYVLLSVQRGTDQGCAAPRPARAAHRHIAVWRYLHAGSCTR